MTSRDAAIRVGRWWNRLKSSVYSRIPFLNELYGRLRGKRRDRVDLPMPPLSHLAKPLSSARVALLTAAGVHLRSDAPFDMVNPDGDASYRLIAEPASVRDLTITHDYYDHRAADRDVNCVFPVERLRELAGDGFIGEVGPRHVAFMGHVLGRERERLLEETAEAMADAFLQDGVDAVLASPG